jgi:hypothetical protein
MDRQDAGLRQGGDGFRLTLEAGRATRVRREALRQGLDRVVSAMSPPWRVVSLNELTWQGILGFCRPA